MEPHVALLPSAGMGHIMPALRFAAMLSSRNCKVTLLTAQPNVSAAESNHLNSFFSAHPHIQRLDFQVIPIQSSNPHDDPFILQMGAIIHSVHLLPPLLSSLSPPISALFLDIAAATCVNQLADDPSLSISYYILSVTCARFFSLISHLPHLTLEGSCENLQLPGLPSFSVSHIPPPLFNPENLFRKQLISNLRAVSKVKGVVSNTFHWFEAETIEALNSGKTMITLPLFLPIGPYKSYKSVCEHTSLPKNWLDEQPAKSVVYVSFGSRTAMSKDQIKELGEGLLKSKQRFLWVLKSVVVDKVEETGLEELLGSSFLERIKEQGMVVKEWVEQEEILAHPAIGGFFSHSGWNSVMEAAQTGVPMLAWPPKGDQRFNAEVMEKAGLGLWPKQWGWLGERLVKSEEIEEKITELMQDHKLRSMAQKVREEATQAWEIGGSSEKVLGQIIEMLKLKV